MTQQGAKISHRWACAIGDLHALTANVQMAQWFRAIAAAVPAAVAVH
jgi:hypothetical protein